MRVCPRLRICAGVAGAIVLALTLHVLMLAGVGMTHQPDVSAAASADHMAVAAVTTPHAMPDAPGGGDHQHAVVGCMAVLAVLGLAVLAGGARRPSVAGGVVGATTPPSRGRRRSVNTALPPGPLLAQGVLLRV